MKIAFHTAGFDSLGLEDALRETSRLGYEYVELASDLTEAPHFGAHTATDQQTERLKTLLARFKLKLAAIDIGGWDVPLCLANLDEPERGKAVENVKRAIDTVGALGCSLISSHLWNLPRGPSVESESRYVEVLKSSIAELCPVLESRHVRLNFMPHPGGFIDESDPTVDLVRQLGCANVGYTYGVGHTFVMSRPGQDVPGMIEYAGATLAHVAVSDTHDVWRIVAPREVGAHEHTAIGTGDIDFETTLSALKAIGYDGFLSVHIISERDRMEQAAGDTKRRLDKLLAVSDRPIPDFSPAGPTRTALE